MTNTEIYRYLHVIGINNKGLGITRDISFKPIFLHDFYFLEIVKRNVKTVFMED